MTSRTFSPMLVLASTFLTAGVGAAQECATDADCPAGYVCAGYAGACPDCPPGQSCDPCVPEAFSVCEILPTTCTADADCEEGLICVHFSGQSCPGAEPCREGDPDCSTEPLPCETVDESYCAPPYVAPCTADADCGPGFTCESGEVCTCVVYPDPGTGEPPPPEECTCEATGESYCALVHQACATDADCPEGLVCTDGAADAAPCFVDENGNESCPGADSEPFCAPPGYVTPLPLEGGDVAAERADAPTASGGGGGGGGADNEDAPEGFSCAGGGAAAWTGMIALLALLPRRRRR
jgi:Cys-rich repeat protein